MRRLAFRIVEEGAPASVPAAEVGVLHQAGTLVDPVQDPYSPVHQAHRVRVVVRTHLVRLQADTLFPFPSAASHLVQDRDQDSLAFPLAAVPASVQEAREARPLGVLADEDHALVGAWVRRLAVLGVLAWAVVDLDLDL